MGRVIKRDELEQRGVRPKRVGAGRAEEVLRQAAPAETRPQEPEALTKAGDQEQESPTEAGEQERESPAEAAAQGREARAQALEEGRGALAEVLEQPGEAEQVDRVRRLVQAMLRGFAQQRRELLAELRPYVVRLAVEIARRIVQRELRTDPGLIVRTTDTALEQVASASGVRVRVHPLDAELLQQTMSEMVPAPDRAAAIEVVPDGSIEQGGCVVESDRGIVDARLRTQFEEMQTSLLDALEGHGSQEEAEG